MSQLSYVLLLSLAIAGGIPNAIPTPLQSTSAQAQVTSNSTTANFCPGERFSIKTPPLSSEPYIELTVGEQTGPFLIDYGATTSSVEQGLLANSDSPVTLTGPNLPGLPDQNLFAVYDRNVVQPGVGAQLGVIGTDILSKLTVEMRFENANDEHLVVSQNCDTRQLAERGFWRFDQQGFFSANPADQNRANVPVLYMDFQQNTTGAALGIRTWVQIDPGYGDSVYPYSVDINDAYYAKLVAAKVPLVEVDSITLQDCQATPRTDRVYVMPGHSLRIEAADGATMYRQPSFYLIHKGRGSGQCGGIATLDEPAAQFGASFLRVLGRIIFDPAQEAVWVLPTSFNELTPGGN